MATGGEYLFAPKRKKSAGSTTPQQIPSTAVTDHRRREGNNDWCLCGRCIAMPTAAECVCCREVESVLAKQTGGCVTLHDDFTDVCLKREVLRSVVVLLHDQQGSRLEEPISNRFAQQISVCD